MSRSIFISHAVNDKSLVDSFVDLLQTGGNIRTEEIFCSSLEGLGIPSGSNFIEFIKQQLQSPKAVILILSPNYYSSHFCLCELGATWMLSNNIFPLIIEPLKYEDIKGVLTGIQVNRINDKDDLNIFIESLIRVLENDGFSIARWEIKRDAFLSKLKAIIDGLPKPSQVTQKEYSELEDKYDAAKKELAKTIEANERQEVIIEELKKLKDKDQARAVLVGGLKEKEKYDSLIEEAKAVLGINSTIVNYALYKYQLGENIIINNYFEQKDMDREAREASENDFLVHEGNSYRLNLDDPSISKSLEAISELKKMLDSISKDLFDILVEEYGFIPKIENKRFWIEILEERINY